MKDFPVNRLLVSVRGFQDLVSAPSKFDSTLDIKAMKRGLMNMIREFEECGLPHTADQLKRIVMSLEGGYITDYPDVAPFLPEVMNRLEDECKRKFVLSIDGDHSKYYSHAQLFDSSDDNVPKVSAQFSSANEDIAEAGNCLACGRPTACVMHLNRIVEVGLKALAAALGSAPQNDWGKYLSKIDEELQTRMKASGSRTTDEQFYAEAQLTCDSVRRAWRNPTMHVDKTYTEERAEEILIAVRSFMRHLATKLHD
jgi:HEPN domain-containing protein